MIVGSFSSLVTTIEPDYNDVTEYNFINMTGNWDGIVCEPYSHVILNRTKISGAQRALNGSPSSCVVEQCEFTDCEIGVWLNACKNPMIKNNVFNGMGIGTGIGLIQSNGEISGNTIRNYYYGINTYMSSPLVIKNILKDNKICGFTTLGMNSYPTLINPLEKYSILNNTIVDNGSYVDPGVAPSQISVGIGSSIYLNHGMNNIYSNPTGIVPEIPCVKAYTIVPEGETPRIQLLYAKNNYWGSSEVTRDFFQVYGEYGIIYDPWIADPFRETPQPSPLPEPDSKSYELLVKSLESELDGKYDKSIKSYEKILDKYPDSEEALIAYAKLPDSYNEEGLDLEPLIRAYDENIAGTDDKLRKKFFKEMKVATHLKGKKYDDAIAISEEMILEAETEEEILYEIDIEVANMLKNAESKGSSKIDHTATISDLLAKLNGEYDTGDKTDVVESQLPSEFMLYQNYPNPFNPVTQIKFALPTESEVRLNVNNINGQLVSELVNGSKEAGIHTVNFDASNYNSGMYFYTLEANGMSITKKMILTK